MEKKIITTVIDKKLWERIEEIGKRKFGKKGYFSKILELALKEWERKEREENLRKEVLSWLEKGFEGKKWKFKREEIYER